MITITQQSHPELYDSIRMCAQQIERNDLCADGKTIWYKWVYYLEKEVFELLDESRVLEVKGIDTYCFDCGYIDFNDLDRHRLRTK